MKKLLIIFLLFANLAYSDQLLIPFDCYPKEVQKQLAKTGRKLDLSGNDRTEDSWGFIENKGSVYIIYTYKSATKDDLGAIMTLVQGGVWQKPQ
ncbi:MAG TPA: hypothetical protein ENI23_06440 [bacterium]|nr:hypothetical protein [bacterium]